MIISGVPVVEYVAARVGSELFPPCSGIGEVRDGLIISGVVFNCFTGPDIEITVASDGMLSRSLLRSCGAYVFTQLGCERATITTESEQVAALAARLGAQTEGRKRNQYGQGRDGIVLGILREDWKFG